MSYIDDTELDLTSCDREPIHKLGLIQNIGVLLVLSSDWLVVQRSTNVDEYLDPPGPIDVGTPLSDILPSDKLAQLRLAVDALDVAGRVERVFGIELFEDGRRFDCAIHCTGGFTVLEIENAGGDLSFGYASRLQSLMRRLDGEDSISGLCERAAIELKGILGFDRIMVYKFRPDHSGEVIAEAREPHLEAFLNLRYPKSDIPDQARELYRRNLFRIIADVNGEPVPIEPERRIDGRELDLSLSTLRAVSPIHLEYLRNMGVGASLSISILQDGKLWGLFACHHYSPRTLPFALRTVAELFAEYFSLRLQVVLDRERRNIADKGRALQERLMSRLAGGSDLVESLATIDNVIGEVIPHDGSSAYIDGIYRQRGKAPNEEEFRAIVPSLNTSAAAQVFATDALAERIPHAADFADRAVGALIIPVSRRPRDYIVLWRQELKQQVMWAGNPEKAVEYGKHGARLTPRKSFAAWQESVSGHAEDWHAAELEVAERLRVALLEIILKLTDETVRERERAQEQQSLLIAELNHRVRNILNLIRGLVGQSGKNASSIEEFAATVGGRVDALASAHDNITRQNWSPAPVRDLINSEMEAYLHGQNDRLQVIGPRAMIAPEAYTVLALVLHEMVTNSAKYGALCDSSGSITLTMQRNRDGDLQLEWKEAGGPPVRTPERRGFGSTIIERSIPHELKGDAKIQYKLSGVEACFIIPGRYVDFPEGDDEAQTPTAPPPSVGARETVRANDVLLVEDSMIIALDTEDALRHLGVKDVRACASVKDALAAIEEREPDFALLDYNLGNESSVGVARELTRRGIPFYFATGYGSSIADMESDVHPKGVLNKPYSPDDLAGVLNGE